MNDVTPIFELVVPAYNEAQSLEELVTRFAESSIRHGFTPDTFQLVIVDNGSTDSTVTELERLKRSQWASYFRIVTVKENLGYGKGVFLGLMSTTAPIIGWSHADLQCNPVDCFTAFEKIKNSDRKDFIKGYRSGRDWKDRIVTGVFEMVARLILGLNLREINAQPKVFQRSLLASLKSPPTGISFDLYVLYCALKENFEIKTIPVELPPRVFGSSKWASGFILRYKTIFKVIRDVIKISVQEGRLKSPSTLTS